MGGYKITKSTVKARIIIVLTLVLVVFCGINAQASSKKKRALKAYSKFLQKNIITIWPKKDVLSLTDIYYRKQKSDKVKFATAYINNDDIPELIVGKDQLYGVYTYLNKKVKPVIRLYKPIGYYKKRGLIKDYGVEGNYAANCYYYMTGSCSAREILRKEMDVYGASYAPGDSELLEIFEADERKYVEIEKSKKKVKLIRYTDYTVDGLGLLSHRQFDAIIAGFTGGQEITPFKTRSNTKKNRSKYLK